MEKEDWRRGISEAAPRVYLRDLRKKVMANSTPSLGLGLDKQVLVKYAAKLDDFESRETGLACHKITRNTP